MPTVSELYLGRRTYRRFKQDPMPEALAAQILENCRTASSARNGQTLKFYAVLSPEKVAVMNTLVKFAGALPPELGTPKEGEKPVAFIVIVKTKPEDAWADIDAGIATDMITMTAWESGFGSCVMGAINVGEIGKLLDLDPSEKVRLAIALGKPDHKSTLVEVPESGSLSYYVDENVDYYVPKKAFDQVCFIV